MATTQNSANNYDTVIFIGNGFDIACGYKTSYSDFVNSDYGKRLMRENNYIFQHIKEQYELKNWVDVEVEIGNYSNIITKKYGAEHDIVAKAFYNDYIKLSADLSYYLYAETKKPCQNITNIDSIYGMVEGITSPTYVINFNYTQICKDVFNKCKDKISIRNIHGALLQHTNYEIAPIVLGVDELFKLNNANHKFLIKSRSNYFNMSGIDAIIQNASKYIFYGTSLGSTDEVFLSDVFSYTGKEYTIYTLQRDERQILDRIEVLSKCSLSKFRRQNDFKIISV